MLGPSSCPPKNVTDRASTGPLSNCADRAQRHVPEASDVGEPIAKCRSSVKIDELSLIRT
jgi:hypothetical protein